ncbi:hypothetical protein NIES2109_61070 (plasmid) [Nostoc sp. HK-01]|nr:hypothetical protein NIES2109_61070 [Nostoc sp. HK-01]
MEITKIFSEAIKKRNVNSQKEIERDLTFLLTLVVDQAKFTQEVKELLTGDTLSLDFLNKIQKLSQTSPPLKFGPVLATQAAAAERLALSVKLDLNKWQTEVKIFVENSNSDLLEIFNVARQTQDYLDETTLNGTRWSREAVPAFLQKTLENSSVLSDITIASTGGELPANWRNVESWIEHWAKFRKKSPKSNPGGDGFFEPQHSGYQVAAIHPLTLRVLRQSFLNQLNRDGSQEDIKAFCQWLLESTFDRILLTNIKLESVFAAGSLILTLAQQQGVVILEDGQLNVPEAAAFWGDLSERVLQTIVNNSQNIKGVPAFWENAQVQIRQILYSCPEWHFTPLITNLRNRASKLLGEQLESLKSVVLSDTFKITEENFSPQLELFSQNILPELRSNNPIDTNVSKAPDRQEYFNKLDSFNNQIVDISSFDSVIQGISANAHQARVAFEQRLASPLAQTALPALATSSFEQPNRLNLALTTYLRQQISQIFLNSKLVHSNKEIQESLASQSAWKNTINQTGKTDEEVLFNWSKLSIWDGLRGRLSQKSNNEGDQNITVYLSRQLPEWLNQAVDLPKGLDLNAIRPTLAEFAHLGVSIQDGTYSKLADRLEKLLEKPLDDNLDAAPALALKALLAAMRLDLGLTAIAVGLAPGQAFEQFGSPNTENLTKFAGWISLAIESNNTWESCAGMNALILLARLSEVTGDILIGSTIRTVMPSKAVRASRLVFQSVEKLFSSGTKGSGLALAFAAFDLIRYTRASLLFDTPDNLIPVWIPGSVSEYLDKLTNRWGSETQTQIQTMIAEGGIGLKIFLLSLLQIKLDELNWECQLIVQPLRRNAVGEEANLKHNIILKQVNDLQKAVRFVFCREQLLLNDLPEVISEIKPWWQVGYWLTSSEFLKNTQLNPIKIVSSVLASDLEKQVIPAEIKAFLGDISVNATVISVLQRQRWLITVSQRNETYLIEQNESADNLLIYYINAPFLLINWIASYPNNIETNLLNIAAKLESSIPLVSENNPQDIDGRYEGEFPDFSWQESTNNLQNALVWIKENEKKYESALKEQIEGQRTEEIKNLLTQSLLLNTADYQEQIVSAIAQVREAEADLEMAEFESLATQFEVVSNQMLYEAAKVEVERENIFENISNLDKDIDKLKQKAVSIEKKQAQNEIEIKKRELEIAKNSLQTALKKLEKTKISITAIVSEINLLKILLETEFEVDIGKFDGTTKKEKVYGQIGVMAAKVQNTLIKQLNNELEKAKTELKKAKNLQAKRKKRSRWGRLVKGICRFVGVLTGVVIGSIYGGSAGATFGATLGSEIGGTIGELADGIIENKPLEEILVGLIDNGLDIAKSSGFDVEKELSLLDIKGKNELNKFFDKLNPKLEILLDNLPRILDEQLVKDAIVVLDIQEIPVLTEILENSYEDLKKDIPKLGKLETTLKAIQYDSPRSFLQHLSKNLLNNTKGNVKAIKALSQLMGKEITTEDELKDAITRFAKLVVTSIGQQAVNFRQDLISTWIRNKRDKKQWWNQDVEKEANDLVQKLFPNEKIQAEVMANLQLFLLDPKSIRGELQIYLDPWLQELDKRINEITAVKDISQPKSAVEAANQNVEYLETCIDKFNKSLFPWLKGDGNNERSQLLQNLSDLQTQKLPSNDIDLKIDKLNENIAQLSEANAKDILKNMENELSRIELLYQASDIQVSKTTLLSKASKLAKLKATNLQTAQENALQASEKRQLAAQAKVTAAQFNLASKKAQEQAAMRRAAEASRIRGNLSQPPLRLPNLSADAINNLRVSYTQSLGDAFSAYRELLRFYYSAGATNIPKLKRNSSTWSEVLGKWTEDAQKYFSTSIDREDPQTVEWELTPEQIVALLSPDGFRVIFAPGITDAPPLFTVDIELKSYLQENKLLNSPWIKAFAQVGINLSDEVSAELERTELDGDGISIWKITDKQTKLISVVAYKRNGEMSHVWNINSEPVSYTVFVFSKRNIIEVTRRQKPPSVGRSPFPNQYWRPIDEDAAKTGRLIGVFLDATIKGTNTKLRESDYRVEVKHLGDFWSDQKQIQLLHTTKLLRSDRTVFLEQNATPKQALEAIINSSEGEGDPHPYAVQGTPLSGTTLIRLVSQGTQEFNNIKLMLLYKFNASAGK